MSKFFSDKWIEALSTGKYACSQCGKEMHFENEFEETLVCDYCGHDVDIDLYGNEDEEDYKSLYPTKEEVLGILPEDDDPDWKM